MSVRLLLLAACRARIGWGVRLETTRGEESLQGQGDRGAGLLACF